MSVKTTQPKALQQLINYFSRFSGVGHRTAERMALALLEWPEELLEKFGTEIATLRQKVRHCHCCGNYTEEELCLICRNPERQRHLICVVETAAQINVIENSDCFRGVYHVLGGKLSPLNGRTPADLRIEELRQRLQNGEVRELIVATSPDVEGEATAHFLANEFAGLPLIVSRIASGLPAGSDLIYADAATLTMALGGRHKL